MKNYIQPGNTVTVSAPYAVASGSGVLVGSLFGVAAGAAAEGAEVEIETVGVYDLPKAAAQEWQPGARIYWDDTESECTAEADDGEEPPVANTLIGVALAAAANPSATGRVRLNGSF